MNISESTLSILQNFASINKSIQFKKGSVLKTVSPTKTILAEANLDFEIKSDFAIYDLNRFLGVLSMFKEPRFDIGEKSMVIFDDRNRVSYTYADPSMIILPPEGEFNIGDPDVQFDVKYSDLSQTLKACGVMSLREIAIVGEDDHIFLRALDTKNPISDTFDVRVGNTYKTFMAIFRSEYLKLLPVDYTVSLVRKGISHFQNDLVDYWITLESSSTFE